MTSFSAGGKWLLGMLALLMLTVAVAGCAAKVAKDDKPIFMRLFGFNYTDRYLRFVRVDGNYLGGLNAYLNGGSSSMGRRKFNGNPVAIRVTWEEGNHYDLVTNKHVTDGHAVRREALVDLKYPYPKGATTLVLQFLPDGAVEAELVMRDIDKWDVRRVPVPKEHSYHVRGY